MKAAILLGAPGAGKGTVASTIVTARNYTQVSTGDMLRAALRAGTALGLEAKGYMERGDLVPDALIDRMVAERLTQSPADARLLFDGYPRTVAQATALDAALAQHGTSVAAVIQLDVPDDLLIRRIVGRRVCKQCAAVYNIHSMKSRVDGVCDKCGGPLYQRADDNESTVRNRLDVYMRQTSSLIEFYSGRGLLKRVDGSDREVTERAVIGVLDEVG